MARRNWSSEEKIRIIMESLTTNISVADLCRKHAVSPVQFYQWKERFIEGGKTALSGPHKRTADEMERLKRLIGELTIANDAFKKTLEGGKR